MAAYRYRLRRGGAGAPGAALVAALGLALGAAAPAAATSIDPSWPDPMEPSLKDDWHGEGAARSPDLSGHGFRDAVRGRPDALLDLHGVVHPTAAEAPAVPGRASEALESTLAEGLSADPTEFGGARLDRKTGGAPLPWEVRSNSVFADVLRNVPEQVARSSEHGLRDALITGLAASRAALPPPVEVDPEAERGARAAATSNAIAAAADASPTGASPNDRGPIAILLLIVILMSTMIFVIARPSSPKPQLLRSRRFGH